MVAKHSDRDELLRQLAWQESQGIDEALLDDPMTDQPVSVRDLLSQTSQKTTGLSAVSDMDMAPTGADNARADRLAPTKPLSPTTQVSQPATSVASRPVTSPTARDLTALTSLTDLRDALGRLDECPLKHTASNMIFADGNPGARLMVIGDVPGREEDRVGLPLVGDAGQLFDRMMASIGLTRADLYITSLLPWRPPGNRTPTPEEMDMLLPWLHRHIQLATPQHVLVLGGGPAKAILNLPGGILKLRGRWSDVDYGGGVVRSTMATLHPSYLLRSPAQKRLAFADLVALAEKLG